MNKTQKLAETSTVTLDDFAVLMEKEITPAKFDTIKRLWPKLLKRLRKERTDRIAQDTQAESLQMQLRQKEGERTLLTQDVEALSDEISRLAITGKQHVHPRFMARCRSCGYQSISGLGTTLKAAKPGYGSGSVTVKANTHTGSAQCHACGSTLGFRYIKIS